MERPGSRILPALGIHLAIHLVLFTIISWAIVHFWGLQMQYALVGGLLGSAVTLSVEWIISPALILSFMKPRWIDYEEDVVLWSLVRGEAKNAGVVVNRIGVIDIEAPNALALSSTAGGCTILLTRRLLTELTYREVRALTVYLMGCSRSGVLGVATMFTGLMAISHRVAKGYIRSRLHGSPVGIPEILLAGWGYLLFALIYSQTAMASRLMSGYADAYAKRVTSMEFKMTLLKISFLLASDPSNSLRESYIALKSLMFLDPTSSLKDISELKDAAEKSGIRVGHLLDVGEVEFPEDLRFHIFEKFWVQESFADRFMELDENEILQLQDIERGY
jgi:Zn-dependent protease with chaperone function